MTGRQRTMARSEYGTSRARSASPRPHDRVPARRSPIPFLRETASLAAGRWNLPGQLTHCFSDTPDGAWAEFLRHEEITDPADIPHIHRALWAVEIEDPPAASSGLPNHVLTGGRASWAACQREANRLRGAGQPGLTAPSAALVPGGAHGFRVEGASDPALRGTVSPSCSSARGQTSSAGKRWRREARLLTCSTASVTSDVRGAGGCPTALLQWRDIGTAYTADRLACR